MQRQCTPPIYIKPEPVPAAQEDVFAKMDIQVPAYLDTSTKRWSILLLVAVSGAFASGPFATWPTLEPLLIGEGVWAGPMQQENLSSVFSIAMGVGMMSSLVSGVMYDALGARAVGYIGAFGVTFFLLLMALAIKVQSLNWLLWIAYPAATAFAWGNSMDVYAWLWLLPEDQNTVSAVVGAIQCLSDALCLIAVVMHDDLGIQLPVYFSIVAFLSVIAGLIAMVFIPSHEEMRRISRSVIAYQAKFEKPMEELGYGSTDSPELSPFVSEEPPADPTVMETLSTSWTAIKDSTSLFCRVHPSVSALYWMYCMMQYMFVVYPCFIMYHLYTDLLGIPRAVTLVNIFGGLYAGMGAVCLVLLGKITDHFGLPQVIFWLNVPTVLNAYLFAVPTMFSEVFAQVLLSFLVNAWYVYYPRFCTCYGPPQLFGTMFGIFGLTQGIGQMVCTRFGTWATSIITAGLYNGVPPPGLTFLATIDLWCVLQVVFSAALLMWWYYYPLPQPGATTMAHVRHAGSDSARSEGGITTGSHSAEKLLTSKPLSQAKKPDAAKVPLVLEDAVAGQGQPSSGNCCGCLSGIGHSREAGMP